MSQCCDDFQSNEVEVVREPNPIFRGLNDCGDKGSYLGVDGTEYKVGMPVKPGSNPGEVVPALDGVGVIGLSLTTITATTGDKITVWRTGHVRWSDIAESIGKDPLSESDWWPIHNELAKANVYVEFK